MGLGTAWGGRSPCKRDIQRGSIPRRSSTRRSFAVHGAVLKVSSAMERDEYGYLKLQFRESIR